MRFSATTGGRSREPKGAVPYDNRPTGWTNRPNRVSNQDKMRRNPYKVLTPSELVVHHAIGGSGHSRVLGWRNHYFTAAEDLDCHQAIQEGLLRKGSQFGDQAYFHATKKGMEHVCAKTGQSYYLEFT